MVGKPKQILMHRFYYSCLLLIGLGLVERFFFALNFVSLFFQVCRRIDMPMYIYIKFTVMTKDYTGF